MDFRDYLLLGLMVLLFSIYAIAAHRVPVTGSGAGTALCAR